MALSGNTIASLSCRRAGVILGSFAIIVFAAAVPSVVNGSSVPQDIDAATDGLPWPHLQKTFSKIQTPRFVPSSVVNTDAAATVQNFSLGNDTTTSAATGLRSGTADHHARNEGNQPTGPTKHKRGLESDTDGDGDDLVNLGNSLSELLSEIPNLQTKVADIDMDSMKSILITLEMDSGKPAAAAGVPASAASPSATSLPGLLSLFEGIVSSGEFPRLQNWFILILYIFSVILSNPGIGAPVVAGGANEEIMRGAMVNIVTDGAAASPGATESQIDTVADALINDGIKTLINTVKESSQAALVDRRQLQTGDILEELDQFLIELPRIIESTLSGAELSLFCIIYDSISFALTAIFRLVLRIINELIQLFLGANDENFIIQSEDIAYFLSFPERLALCGAIPGFPTDPEDVGFCLGLNLLPLVPILFRMYLAIFTSRFTTLNSGVAVTSPDYLFGEQDSETIKLGTYTRNILESDGFYDLTCPEFESAFGDFQDGLQRLVSYEQVLVDKSFASIRVTTNIKVKREKKGSGKKSEKKSEKKSKEKSEKKPEEKAVKKSEEKLAKKSEKKSEKKSKKKSGKKGKSHRRRLKKNRPKKEKSCKPKRSSRKSKSSKSKSKSSKKEQCPSQECDAFVSAGVKNSLTCDAIERDDLNYLGSNCKIMTQIILDKFEEDEFLKDHLFDQYCDELNGFNYDDVNVPFMTRSEGCTRENMCGKKSGKKSDKKGRDKCTIHDLPILKDIFMPNGVLPKYLISRPAEDLSDLSTSVADVTMIPTMYTLRHFGSNQLPALDLISMAISSHLLTDINLGRQPEPTIPKILFQILGSIPGFDLDLILGGASDLLFASGQDPLIYALIREFFLGEDPSDECGPSFAVINRNSFRRFFSFDDDELCDQPQSTPVEDYASIFASIPLLADVGNKITVVNPGTPYFERHPYNNDHDLLALTLAVYFGNDVVIDCVSYGNIFDYIQDTIFEPLDIPRTEWYFPGSVPASESPVLNGEAVSLTIEAQPGIVRDLLPLDIENTINDFLPNTYAVLLADSLEYVERYESADLSYSPWLGQGTCFMSSAAWTDLYSDHYINGGLEAVTPQGYKFRNGGDHEFSTIANNRRDFWSTLGEEFDADTTPGFLPNSVIFGEDCKAFGWGAYSSGYITVSDCPSTCKEGNERDVIATYISNQLDLFGLSFKSIYLLILANIINGLFVNAGNPNDLFNDNPLNLTDLSNPAEFSKIGLFLFAAIGESAFGSALPPLNDDVTDYCANVDNTLVECGIICDYCENVEPNVCGVSFELDVTPPPGSTKDIPTIISDFGAAAPELAFIASFIQDDQSIHCNLASDWEDTCVAALAGGTGTCFVVPP